VIEIVREGFLRDQFRGEHFFRGENNGRFYDLDGGTRCA